MHDDPDATQVALQLRSAVVGHDLGVAPHDPEVSTNRADSKHVLSLDPEALISDQRAMGARARILAERIKQARLAAGLSQAKLGELVGQAQTTISSWERGRTEPTRDDVARIAIACDLEPRNLEVEEEFVNDESRLPRRSVPVVGYVGAGAAAHYYDSAQGPLDQVLAPKDATDSTVGAEVRGPSIGDFFDGWYIFYNDDRLPPTPDLIGELCVVGLPDGRILVKKLQASKAPGLYHLLSMTEPPILDQEVVWAAMVTEMRPRR